MKLTFTDFEIQPNYFLHPSELHGARHTYRVMCAVLALGDAVGLEHEKRLAFFAALVHDMARTHDGLSLSHGPRAARIKVPQFMYLFRQYGLLDEDIETIKTAVRNHSRYMELKKTHPHYLTTALLKDADALDRCRLGENDLNKRYLRFESTFDMVAQAHQLYHESEKIPSISFEQMFRLAEKVYHKDLNL